MEWGRLFDTPEWGRLFDNLDTIREKAFCLIPLTHENI